MDTISFKVNFTEDSNDRDHKLTCTNIIAHYLFFLSLVNQFMFFFIACIFARVTKIESDWEEHEQHTPLENFRHIMFPMFCWIRLARNRPFNTVLLGIQTLLTMMSTISYFFQIAYSGDNQILFLL